MVDKNGERGQGRRRRVGDSLAAYTLAPGHLVSALVGLHWGNAWISFESVPKPNALEIVRGSHRGPRYDGTTFVDPENPTDPLHGGGAWPRLPDIEAAHRT